MFDLPQLYRKPSAEELLQALDLLAIKPRNFGSAADDAPRKVVVDPAGISQYLTSIVSSSLSWIKSDEAKEEVWNAAAARLSERSGRTAMPSMSRVFHIPLSDAQEVALTLHEPSLTADNLGMKTWVSSFVLSRRLHTILDAVPELVPSESTTSQCSQQKVRALELGSGTGLVGLSFAVLRGASASVHLTDLPAIVPNLSHNVDLNRSVLESSGAQVSTGVLDWSVVPDTEPTREERYDIILAADPLYSPEHPKWLVQTIARWLSTGLNARVVVEMPLREAYLPQVEEFRQRMTDIGLGIIEQGEEVAYDDWETATGDLIGVRCWWSVWGWSEKV